MTLANIILGAPSWLWPAAVLTALLVILVVWSYVRARARSGVRLLAALLKVAGVVALALCLIEPLFSGLRPRPGANGGPGSRTVWAGAWSSWSACRCSS